MQRLNIYIGFTTQTIDGPLATKWKYELNSRSSHIVWFALVSFTYAGVLSEANSKRETGIFDFRIHYVCMPIQIIDWHRPKFIQCKYPSSLFHGDYLRPKGENTHIVHVPLYAMCACVLHGVP